MVALRLVGSLLFAFIFLAAGFNTLANYDASLAMTAKKMAPLRLPAQLVTASFVVSIALKVLGGVLLVVGAFNPVLRKVGAYTLILFLLPVTVVIHDFWNLEEGPAKQAESAQFFKNVALLGALICFIADTHTHSGKNQETSKREERATGGRKNVKKID